MHEVRRVAERDLALGQRLADEAELLLLEVADPAVHELRRARRRADGEVAPLDQGGAQAPEAASSAQPAPVIPPPTMTTSKSSAARRSSAVARSKRTREGYPEVTDR